MLIKSAAILLIAGAAAFPAPAPEPAPVPDSLPEFDHYEHLESRQQGCVSNRNNADALQNLLNRGGPGYVLRLCPNQEYLLDKPILFNHTNQEISTLGYPRDNRRATLKVGGDPNTNVLAVRGNLLGLDGCKLRNIQCDGNRKQGPRIPRSQGIIEMGGHTAGQVVEWVRSFDPRGWTCLHGAEGPQPSVCRGMRVANNQFGPAGFDDSVPVELRGWSDGISFACSNSLVENNYIVDATDGGIVVFGAPGTVIRNNTIENKERTALAGIAMAQSAWGVGNFRGLEVYGNTIRGPFADSCGDNPRRVGPNKLNVFTKVGIAVGSGVTQSALQDPSVAVFGMSVHDNYLTGGFGYGIAVGLAHDLSVQNNRIENANFFGTQVERCFFESEDGGQHPHGPLDYIYYAGSTSNLKLQSDFKQAEVWYLICIQPPGGEKNLWPYPQNLRC